MMFEWTGWGMWLIGPVVLALLIWLVVSLIRDLTSPPAARANSARPRTVLDDRLARGEIDTVEYLERLAILERR